VDIIDLHFQGRERVIAATVLRGPDGFTIIDPGPTSCLAALESGLSRLGGSLADVRTILLTHIHLDHAGATGTILSRVPDARVAVHERGAPHMIDPTKLLSSATRLYGDRMDALWGAFEAVPAERVQPLQGGEQVSAGDRTLEVAYTPGHAVHHVSYFDPGEGLAYVGDTCGIRVVRDYVIAATPPPDIDVPVWHESLNSIAKWQPRALLVTHFGLVPDAAGYLPRYRVVLDRTAEIVRQSLADEGSDETRATSFVARMRAEARGALSEREAEALETAAPFEQIWAGLARYWRRQAQPAPTRRDGAQ
jgi:glyoxylase-like metal-dependent hydrolase (beta-lactamase superfamily II)